MKGWKHMTQKDFDQIRALLDVGVSIKQTAEVTKRSDVTVGTIAKCKTFAEYKRRIGVPKAKATHTPKATRVDSFTAIDRKLSTIIEILERMQHIGTFELYKDTKHVH